MPPPPSTCRLYGHHFATHSPFNPHLGMRKRFSSCCVNITNTFLIVIIHINGSCMALRSTSHSGWMAQCPPAKGRRGDAVRNLLIPSWTHQSSPLASAGAELCQLTGTGKFARTNVFVCAVVVSVVVAPLALISTYIRNCKSSPSVCVCVARKQSDWATQVSNYIFIVSRPSDMRRMQI